MTVLERSLLGNDIGDWGIATGIAAGTLLALLALRALAARRLTEWARRTATPLDDLFADLVVRARWFFLLAIAVVLALHVLQLPPRATRIVNALVLIAVLLQVALWGNHAIGAWLERSLRRPHAADIAGATTLRMSGFVARVVLWSVLVLAVLDNLGFNVTTLVASLGIGGIAVALAVQNVLGDVFASLSITLDKPFESGDFIIVDDYLGTVENIGLKTTRVRSLSGEQIVLSNTDLLKSRIRNYKRMFERRVPLQFGVVYQTGADVLARIPGIVSEIVTSQPKTRFDRAHFREFGDSALVFEVVYYVQDPDYNMYMDIQQAINLALLRRFQDEGIAFAYPTRTLHVSPSPPTGNPGENQ